MNSALVDTLRRVGKETHALTLADGSEILVLPYGGRVLGLFAPGDDRNFLWTHPALASAESAAAFYASDEWQNSGGDRTWLAPEIEFFLPDYPEVTNYFQQRSLDPGSYAVETADGELRLSMDFAVVPSSTKQPVRLRIAKSVASAPNPLPARAGLTYAGYELRTTLEGLEPLPVSIGLWSLLQMPFGGEMLIPTYGKQNPLIVFGVPPEGHVNAQDGCVRYLMQSVGDHKIGLSALGCTGRVGYFHETDGAAHLIVRNFFINPSGAYVDCNWADPSDNGYGVQACSLNGQFGLFSELEYHSPAITAEAPRAEDVSQVWAYRGSREEIAEVAQRLLGLALG